MTRERARLDADRERARLDADRDRAAPGPGFEPTWLLVAVLAVIYAFAFVDRNVISLLVEPIERSLGVSDLRMSLLLGLGFSIFIALVNIPAGIATDRFGRRGLIAAAAVMWSLMTVLSGLSGSFAQLLLCRMGVGFSEAFLTPATFSLIRDRVDLKLRGRAYSVIGLAPSLGAASSFVIGGALVGAHARGDFAGWPLLGDLVDWQVVLVVVGTAGLMPTALLWLLRRDAHRENPAGWTIGGQFADAWRNMAAESRRYTLLIAYASTGAMVAAGYFSWFPTVMGRNFGMSVAQIGKTAGPILMAASITGLVTCGFALDWLAARGRSLLLYGLLATTAAATACATTPLARSASEAFALMAVAAFFLGSFYPVGAAMLARMTPSRLMGSTTAIYLLFINLGSGLAPTIVSFLAGELFGGATALGQALALYSIALGGCGLAASLALFFATGKDGPVRR